MSEYRETVYSHDNDMESGVFCVDAGEPWSKAMIKRLKEKYPEEVNIKHENKDGSIQAYLPLKWMKIRPTRKMDLTIEQRAAIAERLQGGQRKQLETLDDIEDDNANLDVYDLDA